MIRFFNLDTTFLINLIVTSYQADHFRFDLFEKSLSRLLDQQAL